MEKVSLYIACMHCLKFILFFNVEPPLQCKSITNKRELIFKKKRKKIYERVCISWIDSTLWNVHNILMYINLIKRKGKKEKKKKEKETCAT